ncbi:hypothetical protein [Pontiella sulfatireligans]|uniref:Uncharacterized protein n=1 Tax=Pontiella sulfatireligans TaxID=2750658 RepID=A0A6C2URK5_9BACT|nr:hypothetical protein [Pontiella sulfatireligans]VGO22888.1 hypothetical protein SCARR_04985 [Pontiella sulfatireligans]
MTICDPIKAFAFVHASNVGDSSLVYRLLDQTNLVNGTVNTNDWDSQMVGPFRNDYIAVSNHYNSAEKQFVHSTTGSVEIGIYESYTT